MAEKVSNEPWGNFKESDYTLEQWIKACIVKPDGDITSKSQCKLPVRTPAGILNKSGVQAAAGALAGARGGVDLTPEQRTKAAATLVRLYAVLGDTPPDSLKHSALSHIAPPVEDEQPTTAVVVAIPRDLDPIRLVGDEDKHATLLYFGETATLPDGAKEAILKSLAQVANIFECFGENIIGIQRLGPDVPPALVAMLSNGQLGNIRNTLLIDSKISEYLQNATQYPDYTPHVTLGYPDYAGEDQLRQLAQTLYRVRFDRLALWWNGEQTEFDLTSFENSYPTESENALAQSEFSSVRSYLSHATESQTIQQFFDSLTSDERDTIATITQAAIDDVALDGNPEIIDSYNALPGLAKNLIDFIVGNALADPKVIQHSEFSSIESFLAHHGVKGMKWGVRKGGLVHTPPKGGSGKTVYDKHSRAVIKARVNQKQASLGDAHLAALKSRGHRTLNAVLGDKTSWKRTAKIAGFAAAGIAASAAVPGLLPSSVLTSIATASGFHATGGVIALVGQSGPYLATATSVGHALATGYGILGTAGVTGALAVANKASTVTRAVRGNARINKSFASLGNEALQRQTSGSKRTQRILNINGSIPKNLLHDEFSSVGAYLEHHGVKGMKWGVRRSDAQLERAATVRSIKESAAGKAALATGRGVGKTASVAGRGVAKTATALKNRRTDKKVAEKMEISQEAAKFIREHQGKGSAMTDQQLRDTINRANLLTQYDSIFNKKQNPNAELQAKVQKLQLEANKKQAEAQIRGAKVKKVNDLVKLSENAFEAYTKLNKATNGSLNEMVSKNIGVSLLSKSGGAHRKGGVRIKVK